MCGRTFAAGADTGAGAACDQAVAADGDQERGGCRGDDRALHVGGGGPGDRQPGDAVSGPRCRDGWSCLPFVEALEKAGIVEQPAERQFLTVTAPMEVRDGELDHHRLAAYRRGIRDFLRSGLRQVEPIRRQLFAYQLDGEFAREIAPARSLSPRPRRRCCSRAGWARTCKAGDVLVLDTTGRSTRNTASPTSACPQGAGPHRRHVPAGLSDPRQDCGPQERAFAEPHDGAAAHADAQCREASKLAWASR